MFSVDFETKAIVFGSDTPPEPVGCAVRDPELGTKKYWAWGHPSGNNCTIEEFGEYLRSIWGCVFVGHNMAFDLGVAMHWFGLPERPWELTHDTLFQAYLINPHEPSLKLKDLAANWLGMPADSQKELQQWILANVPECRTINQTGMYISEAPGDIVGRYAEDDVEMAYELHQYCYPKIQDMLEAYDRERRLSPILAKIQRGGIRIDVERLWKDYDVALKKLRILDDFIRKRLKTPDLNPGSDKELVRALQKCGFTGFHLTPKGALSANKKSLEDVLDADPDLKKMLRSRAAYDTLTGTFMRPWLEYAESNNGTINPSYNQVRNPEGYGTRTGRLSSSDPNGQNVPTDQGLDYFGDPFPLMRSYCLPDEGCVWYSIDFKAQEPRLTAHFENGSFMEAFQNDPDMDPYIFVKDAAGGDTTRKEAKVILLGLIYVMGAGTLAVKLEDDTPQGVARATALRNVVRAALPDVVELDRQCKKRFSLGLPIRTLGGRICYREPSKDGRDWSYKALNLLVQGSAADQTKEAIIYAEEDLAAVVETGRLLGTVHDEINISAPPGLEVYIQQMMTDAANALHCDVPMRITMGVGANWAEASKG